MATVSAEQLIQRAQTGEKLSRADRLHCVGYIMAVTPTLTNREIGEMFGITERAVRQDKQKIRHEKAKLIKDEDIGLVVADVYITFENQVRDLERSKAKCKLGSKEYVSHCKAIFDMRRQSIESLQNLGYYPKNLGNMTVEKFEYRAIFNKDGSADSRPVDMFDAPEKLISGGRDQEAIEAEFEDIKDLSVKTADSELLQDQQGDAGPGSVPAGGTGVTSSSPEAV